MKDTNDIERSITRELREVTKGTKVKWMEWSSSEEQVKKNLVEGEKALYLPRHGIWVAYK